MGLHSGSAPTPLPCPGVAPDLHMSLPGLALTLCYTPTPSSALLDQKAIIPGAEPEHWGTCRKSGRREKGWDMGHRTQDTQHVVTGWPPLTQSTETFFSVCFYL